VKGILDRRSPEGYRLGFGEAGGVRLVGQTLPDVLPSTTSSPDFGLWRGWSKIRLWPIASPM